jgi:ribulose-5-phosphate 4-epimerase/fuculose-1-phosphate aldolase
VATSLERTRTAERSDGSRTFAVVGVAGESLANLTSALVEALEERGFVPTRNEEEAGIVLNLVDRDAPQPFRRRARGTFVAAVWSLPDPPEDPLRETYPMLVRALANISLCYVPGHGVLFTTMERGNYLLPDGPDLAAAVVTRLEPLATSRLVIDNEFRPDLLPAPFPVEELVSDRDLRRIKRLYAIGGLSYGNLSARKDANRFWMSASGVDKAKLEEPGRDILLVSSYDEEANRIVLSVPPGVTPRRVSVDAIEHWMIYRQNPAVGAILHVHAWIDGIAATDINYPCGTAELAASVASLVAAAPDPAHTVVGLRNHGITATGDGLGEILDRIEPDLLRQVPMS